MSDLHTVNKSPFEKDSFGSCVRFSKAGASILLIEDAVYAALKGTAVEQQTTSALGDKKVYVLGPDLNARGFTEERLIDGVQVVDYAGFVDLVETTDKVQAWL